MRKLLIITLLFLILLPRIQSDAKKKALTFEEAIEESSEGFFEITQKILEKYKQFNEDVKLLAEVIYHENWYTDKDKLTAYWTGAVVMNRVHSDEWPDTVYGVLYQKGQYSTTKKFFTVELPDEVYDMARDILINGTPDVPENVVFQATFKQGKIWKQLNGEIFCYG